MKRDYAALSASAPTEPVESSVVVPDKTPTQFVCVSRCFGGNGHDQECPLVVAAKAQAVAEFGSPRPPAEPRADHTDKCHGRMESARMNCSPVYCSCGANARRADPRCEHSFPPDVIGAPCLKCGGRYPFREVTPRPKRGGR